MIAIFRNQLKAYLLAGFFLIVSQHLSLAQKANYPAAEKYDIPKLRGKTSTDKINPYFFQESDKFWFFYEDGTSKNYYWIDPSKGKRHFLYNRQIIAKKLTAIRKETIDSTVIKYNINLSIPAEKETVGFSYKNTRYDYNFYTHDVLEVPEKNPIVIKESIIGNLSPDRSWRLYTRKHNLYLKNSIDTAEVILSTDAAPYYSFAPNESDSLGYKNQASVAAWLDDSKHFYILRKDNRKVKSLSVMYTLASPRPRVETYKYQLPGDKDVTQYELYIGDTGTKKMFKVAADKWADQELTIVKAEPATGDLFFLRKKRTLDEIELCTVNVHTGKVRVIIHEVSKPYINEDLFNVQVLNGSKDILWWSDRSGWGHYYHYSGEGKLLNTITHGNWTAGKLLKVDTLNRSFYFYGYGKEPGRNPYYAHVYRVGFEGRKQSLLTPENASHSATFTPSGKYFIDNYSRIDQVPVMLLKNNKGSVIAELAKPDFRKLFDYGWHAPEPFTVKAKDGVTDLYGIMWKPFDFDPNKKYPVISQVYPGPQTETVWTDFTVYDKYNNAPLAQLGFIVVCMGHRGGSPLRNKAYATYGYGNLRDAPLEDDKYGLEQLAQRYSYIDINRVGIFGHSGGGMMSTAAICTYPDFYKVAVSSSGNHDNTIYNRKWGETYQGVSELHDTTKTGETKARFRFKSDVNQTLMKNLKGHLLLVTGESDQNVNPGNTYRVVDALVKAGKDFDMLVLPGQSHHYDEVYQPYFENKLRHYFAKYLIEDAATQ